MLNLNKSWHSYIHNWYKKPLTKYLIIKGEDLVLECREERNFFGEITYTWKQVEPVPGRDAPIQRTLPADPYCDRCEQGQSKYFVLL